MLAISLLQLQRRSDLNQAKYQTHTLKSILSFAKSLLNNILMFLLCFALFKVLFSAMF
jgi:hypothetical protein